MKRLYCLLLLALMLVPALALAASVVSTSATTSTSMSVTLDTASVKPPWFADLVKALTAALVLAGGYLAKVLGGAISSAATLLAARLGLKVAADQEAAIAAFIEEHIRAQEEKKAAGLFDKVANAGATQLANVTRAVAEKFPKLSQTDIDTKIHSVIQRLPGVGASA